LVGVVVFASAGYVLVHHTAVHGAGKLPRLPAAASIGTTPAPATATATAPATAPTVSRSSGPKPVVAFVGDDWTSGSGASSPAKRFTTLVSTALDLQQLNFGVAGSGYAKQGRSGGDYLSRIPDVVAAGPAMVVVSGGRNDVADSPGFAGAHARRLFRLLRSQLPQAAVIAVAPMWGDSQAPPALHRIAHAVHRAALGAGVNYLSVADPIQGHPGFMADAAHPDDRGYAAIASLLDRRLAPYVPR
jgi:lysophospholipase L1-like esterase